MQAASRAAGRQLPAAVADDLFLWALRLQQLNDDPASAPWLVRVVVAEPDGVVVGHAGFHGPPSPDGMVEIGYEVLPEHRRRGYARAAVLELLAFARDHGATTVRASVAPDNDASQTLIRSFGFEQVGEQWDERDGRELVLERPVPEDPEG